MSSIKSAKIFSDSDFPPTSWSSNRYDNPNIPNAVNAQNCTVKQDTFLVGGNPGTYSRLEIKETEPLRKSNQLVKMSVTNINVCADYDPKRYGKIESIDFSTDLLLVNSSTNPKCKTTYSLLILQDSNYFEGPPIVLQTPDNWRGYVEHNLKQGHFKSAGKPKHPNFDVTGSLLRFGYIVNITGATQLQSTSGIDNWQVIIKSSEISNLDFNTAFNTNVIDTTKLHDQLKIERAERERLERQLISADREIQQLKWNIEKQERLTRPVSPSNPCLSLPSSPMIGGNSESGTSTSSPCLFDGGKLAQKKILEWMNDKKQLTEQLNESKNKIKCLENELEMQTAKTTEAEMMLEQAKNEHGQTKRTNLGLVYQIEELSLSNTALNHDKRNLEEIVAMNSRNLEEMEILKQVNKRYDDMYKENSKNLQMVKSLSESHIRLENQKVELEELLHQNQELNEEEIKLLNSTINNLTQQLSLFSQLEEKRNEEISSLKQNLENEVLQFNQIIENLNLDYENKSKECDVALQTCADLETKFEMEKKVLIEEYESKISTLQKQYQDADVNKNEEFEMIKQRLGKVVLLEKVIKENIESELQKEKAERIAADEEHRNSVNSLVEELEKEKNEVQVLKEQLAVEIELRQKAELALKQLDDIFNVSLDLDEEFVHLDNNKSSEGI